MKLHLVTIGTPHLAYAKQGWDEYVKRLGYFHQVRVSHIADKYAYDAGHILEILGSGYLVCMAIKGRGFTSEALAAFLEQKALDGRELCLVIGGPNGLPQAVVDRADRQWSMSDLTLPHDLAMVVMAEALYRASSINAGHPYHRG